MTRSTKEHLSPGQILLERLDQLRRKLDAACDAFDELYQHVYHLQARHRAKNDAARPAHGPQDDPLKNVF